MGHRRDGVPSTPTPTPCLVGTGACAVVTATHRRGLTTVLTGTQRRPSHTRGGTFMLSHPRFCAFNQIRTRVYTLTNAHRHTSPGTCHHCEHRPKGTDFHVQPQKYSCSDTHVGSPGPFRHCHRWHPRLTRSLGGWASTAKVDRCWHWQRVWAAWVSRVWQLSVSQSPELASLRWGERGNEPQPSSMAPPPSHWPLPNEVNPGKATPTRQAAESPSSLRPRWHQGALWPSTQSPCPTHALE